MREIAALPVVYTEEQVARQLGVHSETLAREAAGQERLF